MNNIMIRASKYSIPRRIGDEYHYSAPNLIMHICQKFIFYQIWEATNFALQKVVKNRNEWIWLIDFWNGMFKFGTLYAGDVLWLFDHKLDVKM